MNKRLRNPNAQSPCHLQRRLRCRSIGHVTRMKRLKAGPNCHSNGLVFTNPDGKPVNWRNRVRQHVKPLLQEAGLPQSVHLYGLRHARATLLMQAN